MDDDKTLWELFASVEPKEAIPPIALVAAAIIGARLLSWLVQGL